MAISSPGLGSNLNVSQIVSQLMAIERQPLDRLVTVEASYQAQLSSYGSIRSALSSFRGAADALGSGTAFGAKTVSSSDSDVATASATSRAVTGSYSLQVTQLAQAHTLAATGQSSTTADIGSGADTTLTFEFGTISGGTLTSGVYSGATFTQNAAIATGTVEIDSSNNSLQGIRDAINAAGIGVRASIVNDGGTNPYRLVLQSTSTGEARAIKISVSGDATLASLLGHDPAGTQNLTQTAAALDAELSVNGLSLSSESNSVSSVVEGLTFNLQDTGSATLTASSDTSAAQSAVDAFVKSYNDLNAAIEQASAANPATRTRSPLTGDATVRSIQAQLRSTLSASLGSGFAFSTLSDIGIGFQRDGSLSLDSSKLSAALSSDAEGVAALFAASGRATDSLVEVSGQTSATQAGNYSLSVSALATKSTLVGSAAAGLTIASGTNDALTVTLDGVSAPVTLTAGTYTASSLASMIQSAVNGKSAFSSRGLSLTVSQSAGVLTFTSQQYGSASAVSLSGNAAEDLVGSSPVATAGVDVAGTIGSYEATGSGQVLTGSDGTPVEGLELEITGGSTGSRGTVTVGKGFGARLSALLDGFLSNRGTIANRTDGINRSIQDLDDQRTTMARRLSDTEARYLAQFTALDVLMSRLTQTSAFLTQQLAALSGNSGSGSGS